MRILVLFTFLIVTVAGFSQDIYVSDAGNFDQPPWQILRYDSSGQNGMVFIEDSLAWPQDILFLEKEGSVWVSNLNSGNITSYQSRTGAFQAHVVEGLEGPTRMRFGPDSLLYILQWNGEGQIIQYDPIKKATVPYSAHGIKQSIGMDWDQDGKLWLSSYGSRAVFRFNNAVDTPELIIDSTHLQGPTNIWFNSREELLVADFKGGAIKKFAQDGTYLGIFSDGLGYSEGVAFLPDGSILVGDGKSHAIKHISAEGKLLGNRVAPEAAGLKTPNAVVLKP